MKALLSPALLVLVACAPLDRAVVPPVAPLAGGDWQQQPAPPVSWAEVLDQPELQRLIAEALANNHDLQAAAARWRAAREQVTVAGGPRWPALAATVEGERRDVDDVRVDTFSAGLDVSWELDLWGKLALGEQAAALGALQEGELLRWSQWSLAAEVTRSWLDAIESDRQLRLAEDRTGSLRESLAIIESGFRAGIREALDVYSARAELATNETIAVQRRQVHQANLRRLATLLGRFPDAELEVPQAFPAVGSPVPPVLAVELLERRPDLRAAANAVLAQQANAGIATRNRLPAINLGARYGTSNDRFSDVFSANDTAWSLLGGITAPLFQGGALAAEQRRQQELLAASIADYRQTALTALAEVEQALDNDVLLDRQFTLGQEAVTISIQAQEQAFEQYVGGLSNLNTWLQAQRTAFDRSSQLVTLQNDMLKNRIDLYLALGGDFGSPQPELGHAAP